MRAGFLRAAVLCLAASPVFAQAPPPAAGAPSPAPEPATPKPVLPVELTVRGGFGNRGLEGDRREYFRYHTAPMGLHAGLLRAMQRDEAGRPLQQVWWRNPGESDAMGYGDLRAPSSAAWLRFWTSQAEFTGDPTVPSSRPSQRRDTLLRLHLARGFQDSPLEIRVSRNESSLPLMSRYLPGRGVHYRSQSVDAETRLQAGKLTLSVNPRFQNQDRLDAGGPDRSTLSLGTEAALPGERSSLTAAFDHVRTVTEGQDAATWNTFRLSGSYLLPGLNLEAYFRHRETSLPFTQTSYTARNQLAGLSASLTPGRRTSVRGGYYFQGLRQETSGSGAGSTPNIQAGWLQLRASDPGLWQGSLRYRARTINDAPSNLAGPSIGRSTLYYTTNHSLDARLDLFPRTGLSTYLDYAFRRQQNGERGTEVTLNSFSFGAATSAWKRVTLSADVTRQAWTGNTSPYLSGPGGPAGGLPPSLFFSDGVVATVNATYQLSGNESIEAGYHQSVATGAQSLRNRLVTFLYRREVGPAFYYAVGYQYERFRDLDAGRSYRALPLLLEIGFQRRLR